MAISPAVLPRPADWDAAQHLTGYWFLPQEAWTPPPALEAFLNSGPPPVSIGFGSMTTPVELRYLHHEEKIDTTFAGVRFHNMSGLVQRQVERFVYQLQREARRTESDGPF